MFYPLWAGAPDRLPLAADPTVHLLGTFGLELIVAWLAVLALAHHRDRRVSEWIAPQAVAGVAFGVAALVLAPPTLERPYLFTASVLPVAAGVGATCWIRPLARWERPSTTTVATTALAALTAAVLAYTSVYLVL